VSGLGDDAQTSSSAMESDYTGLGDELDCLLWTKRANCSRYCSSGGKFRRPMCLIRKGEETRGHKFQGKAEGVWWLKEEGKHEAGKGGTRGADIDVAK